MDEDGLPSWVKEPKGEIENAMQRAFEFGKLVGKFQEKHENNEALLEQIRKSIEGL